MRTVSPLRCTLLAALALAVGAPTPARAQDTSLAVGDKAPAFQAVDDHGDLWRSADHVGDQLLVVYFYPAALSAGCTKQACAFRDDHTRLNELGAEVVGISGDRISNLRAFRGAHQLNFPLLSDTTGAIARSFGVPVGKGGIYTTTVNGKELKLKRDVTAARWTFIIDRTGHVVFKETEVNPAGDSQTVIAAIEKMNANGR
ncbi:MAG TPA: peroxiredoxin [Longimicrobiaceae bacterium]|nr:peroxiredoxin [Longimicrobiaceae bacterium]